MCRTSKHVNEYGAFLTKSRLCPGTARKDCEKLINLACPRRAGQRSTLPEVDYNILVVGSGEPGKYLAWAMAAAGRWVADGVSTI
jgi:hypothetical protein